MREKELESENAKSSFISEKINEIKVLAEEKGWRVEIDESIFLKNCCDVSFYLDLDVIGSFFAEGYKIDIIPTGRMRYTYFKNKKDKENNIYRVIKRPDELLEVASSDKIFYALLDGFSVPDEDLYLIKNQTLVSVDNPWLEIKITDLDTEEEIDLEDNSAVLDTNNVLEAFLFVLGMEISGLVFYFFVFL